MNSEDITSRARTIAEVVAREAGEDRNGQVFCKTYVRVMHYLMRMDRVTAILKRGKLHEFIGPMEQRGFRIIVREEEPGLVSIIEQQCGRPTPEGGIVMPIGFGELQERMEEVLLYQQALLTGADIHSEIITIKHPGTEEDHVALYVP